MSGKKNMLFKSLWQNGKDWMVREVMKENFKELDKKYLFGMMRRLYGNVERESS